jgi:hypothetical protein
MFPQRAVRPVFPTNPVFKGTIAKSGSEEEQKSGKDKKSFDPLFLTSDLLLFAGSIWSLNESPPNVPCLRQAFQISVCRVL